jgi:capsular polysaccharide biosynthesis protein
MRAVLVGLVLAAVLGAIGAIAGRGGVTTYTSRTVMLIDDPYGLAVSGNNSTFVQLDALRFKYADLIHTSPIAQPVANKLHIPVGNITGAVSAEVPNTSLLMDIDATWSSPRQAQLLSQAVADELTNYVKAEDVSFNIPPANAFTLATVDPASAAVAHGPSSRKTLTLAIGLAILGFVVGLLATQFVRYFR